jgi:hypothetical protein
MSKEKHDDPRRDYDMERVIYDKFRLHCGIFRENQTSVDVHFLNYPPDDPSDSRIRKHEGLRRDVKTLLGSRRSYRKISLKY